MKHSILKKSLLIDELTCSRLGLRSRSDALQLARISRHLQTIALRRCNEGFNDRQLRYYEKRIFSLLERAQLILAPFGFTVYHFGDPRSTQLWAVKHALLQYSDYQAHGGVASFDYFLYVKFSSVGIPIIVATEEDCK